MDAFSVSASPDPTEPITPAVLAARAEHLQRMLAFEAANATLDAAIRGHLLAGAFGDAVASVTRLAQFLEEQRDYRGAHAMKQRAWHLSEGARALEDAADTWDLDREVAAVHLTVARERFIAAGFDEATAIAQGALAECDHVPIDLPRLEFAVEEPIEPVFRD